MNDKDIRGENLSPFSGAEDIKDGGIDYDKPTPYMIKILMQMLNMADAEHLLTPMDKNALEDVMKYGSTVEVARLQHVSASAIGLRVQKAIDHLMQQITIWQDPHNKILELTKKIEELEEIADPKRNLIKLQTDKVQALELEVARLQNIIKGQKVTIPRSYKQVNPVLKLTLSRKLEDIGMTAFVVEKLRAHDIYTVYDLVRITDHKLRSLDGITNNDVTFIRRHLVINNLHLGTKVIWSEEKQDYFMGE